MLSADINLRIVIIIRLALPINILIDFKKGFYSPEDTENKAAMMTSSVRESFMNLRKHGMFPAKFKISVGCLAISTIGRVKSKTDEIYIVSVACTRDKNMVTIQLIVQEK
jgi:hypothetical protein